MAPKFPSSMLIVAAAAVTGCTTQAPQASFRLFTRGTASSCTIEHAGKAMSSDELRQLARTQFRAGARAHVDTDTADTPWKCIASAIYTLQMAGFTQVNVGARQPR